MVYQKSLNPGISYRFGFSKSSLVFPIQICWVTIEKEVGIYRVTVHNIKNEENLEEGKAH
jgi:hypothetical protein